MEASLYATLKDFSAVIAGFAAATSAVFGLFLKERFDRRRIESERRLKLLEDALATVVESGTDIRLRLLRSTDCASKGIPIDVWNPLESEDSWRTLFAKFGRLRMTLLLYVPELIPRTSELYEMVKTCVSVAFNQNDLIGRGMAFSDQGRENTRLFMDLDKRFEVGIDKLQAGLIEEIRKLQRRK